MKPGLGGRRCQQCGAKVEGAGSKLLRHCPSCGAPLDGPHFTPAAGNPQFSPPAKSALLLWVVVGLLVVMVGIGVAVLIEVRALQETPPASAAIDAGSAASLPPRILGGTKPFDRVSATQQLNDASETIDDCRDQGAAGSSVVTTIVLQPNGKVSEVTFARAGFGDTGQGKCIADRFSKIRVTAFAGNAEKLSKAVTLP